MKFQIKTLLLSFLFISISCLKEDDGIITIPPIQGAALAPEVGGPNQPYQVWVDLSTGEMKQSLRTIWDLGFYSGDEFAVILNTSALMSATEIEGVTELAEVTSESVSDLMEVVQVANFDPENINYVDDVKGNYLDNGTVIKSENKVYLINLGYGIYEGTFNPGSSYSIGEPRGWKKIKIMSEGNSGYTIQYADLDETQYSEAFIPKDTNYNFSFFSLVDGSTANVQPEKNNWDLCFTVFLNEVADNNGNNQGTYIYSDFVLTNTMTQTGAYEIIDSEETLLETYNNFSAADVEESRFIYNDHRAIGSNWRIVPGAIVRKDRFYVLKDSQGILYKIRFISMSDEEGYRGYPQFEFDPL